MHRSQVARGWACMQHHFIYAFLIFLPPFVKGKLGQVKNNVWIKMRQLSRSQSLMNKSQDLWYCITTAACQRGGLHTSPCPALHRVTSSTVTKTIPIDKAACSSWDGAAIPYKRGGMLHTLWQPRAAALFPNDVILLPGQSSQSQGINIMQTRAFVTGLQASTLDWAQDFLQLADTPGFGAVCLLQKGEAEPDLHPVESYSSIM